MSDLIDRQAALDTEGLDEQIRCEMCRNPMHTDRGCDGNCKYDEKLYERIMQILGERIKPLPPVQPELCSDAIDRQGVIDALTEYGNGRAVYISAEEAVRRIEQLPPAQPEIIHCKDCKWFGDIGCAIEIVDDSDKPTENDFCSFAERRTDGTEQP